MKISKRHLWILGAGVLFVAFTSYTVFLDNRILPHTFIGGISLGGLTHEQAVTRLRSATDQLQHTGIQLTVGDTPETIQLDDVAFELDLDKAADAAFSRGHNASPLANTWQSISSLWSTMRVDAPIQVNADGLAAQLDQAISSVEASPQDVRLSISGTTVRLLTDTRPGKVVDRAVAAQLVMRALADLSGGPIRLELHDNVPVADPATADTAVENAKKMMARGLLLTYEDAQFSISRTRIGSWITSEYSGDQLVAGLDRVAIARYVTTAAQTLNVAYEQPNISTDASGHVTGFSPARVGRAVQEDQLVQTIIQTLTSRIGTAPLSDIISVPMKISPVTLTGLSAAAGITELIGKATTPFTGSPKNRISNIKNGVRFISGALIEPGEEFSTLTRLGTVDNTTGYLPELVIKGDRTKPEFGGGLCQVSTTLFRAVMNAGLPVTARQNHSYRVSYYEKDGNGKKIGPGLDATIFEPNPDFKFQNDTSTPVLIIGYVVGDKITFELYGTKDGRTSAIDGPHLLSETPSGDPKYIETPTLPRGVTKQVETPHAGGTAIATYMVTYPDGHVASQVFRSKYRPWPAQYLVGTNDGCTTAAQCAALFPELLATPFPTPVPSPQ